MKMGGGKRGVDIGRKKVASNGEDRWGERKERQEDGTKGRWAREILGLIL